MSQSADKFPQLTKAHYINYISSPEPNAANPQTSYPRLASNLWLKILCNNFNQPQNPFKKQNDNMSKEEFEEMQRQL